ncbi:MAG: hypothetical protein ACR652_00410 [Methylocystis sp.]|uniref:hypothetical protein n=1 Tax=Methylocystis sp. TaxID=1911079 RepID=UPI003DA62F91
MSIDIIARGLAAKALAGGGGSPGGSSTQFQFNNAGAFGGTSGFTWDSANQVVTLAPAAFAIALSALSINPTWNNGALAFPGALVINPTDTASGALSALADFQLGGISQFKFTKGAVIAGNSGAALPPYMMFANNAFYFGSGSPVSANNRLAMIANGSYQVVSGGRFAWTNSGSNPDTTIDLILYRDAASTLALRNGVNPQTFNIYNTYTDASNYERGILQWNSNVLFIGTDKGGTGVARELRLTSTGSVNIAPNGGTLAWTFTTGGHFLAWTDNAYDIGASGANRPRNLYLAGVANVGGNFNFTVNATIQVNGINYLSFGPSSALTASKSIIVDTGNLIAFGGLTSASSALKGSSATVQVRLADDTAFAAIQGKLTTDNAYTAGAPAATGYVTIYDSAGTAYKVLVST